MDFLDLRCQVVNYYVTNNNGQIPPEFTSLVNNTFPMMPNGYYPVTFTYRLPNGQQGSTVTFNFRNPIE
jgi:hypothetical protein